MQNPLMKRMSRISQFCMIKYKVRQVKFPFFDKKLSDKIEIAIRRHMLPIHNPMRKLIINRIVHKPYERYVLRDRFVTKLRSEYILGYKLTYTSANVEFFENLRD